MLNKIELNGIELNLSTSNIQKDFYLLGSQAQITKIRLLHNVSSHTPHVALLN